MENLLNIRQVAFILKVHPLTVRRYIKDGKLNAVRVGGNVRIKESQLLDFNYKFYVLSFNLALCWRLYLLV